MKDDKLEEIGKDIAVIKNIMQRLEPLVDRHEKMINGGYGIMFFCTAISAIVIFGVNIAKLL